MKRTHKKVLFTVGGVITVCLVTTIVLVVSKNSEEAQAVVYRETTVEYGELTVGITEDATVNIGTTNQTFDLDISALVDSDSSSSSSSASGGNGDFGFGNVGMSFSFGGSTISSEEQEMDVESVHVTVGEEVKAGDVLYTLTESSVNEIRSQLEEDVEDTLEDYQSLQVEQLESKTEAQQEYDTYVTNGKLAQLVYDMAVEELEEALSDAEEAVNEKQDQVNEDTLKLIDLQEQLAVAKEALTEANAAVEANYENRFENAYYYVTFKQAQKSAQELVDGLEDDMEDLQKEIESLQTEIQEAVRTYNQAVRDLETGKLEAQNTYDTDTYYANVASSWYQLQLESLNYDKEASYNSYQSAVSKLENFNAYIVGNDVISEYDGIITDVYLSEGDSVTKNTVLVSLYNTDEITMDVDLSEDDYEAIDKDGKVYISCDAYPDDQFTGYISEVSDATYDSSTATVYYTVTVTLQGDNLTGLYEGMSGEVTFVTKETQEVTYVSNRAITREGTKSYVKVRDESGNIVKKEVTTGFSDGTNVEIVEGLSEGDVVLIESKVSES